MTARGSWKRLERVHARIFGGERVPVTGRARGEAPDVFTKEFAIEVKMRAKLPALLEDAMDQAVKSVRGDQLPLVVIHKKGQRVDNDYVVMRLKDFQKMRGGDTSAGRKVHEKSEHPEEEASVESCVRKCEEERSE